MFRKALARLVLGACLLGWPLAPGLVGCGGEAELMGTETGNPPDVDMRRLRLEWTQSGVELIGEAGAVPAGAEVRLRNSRTGESATGTANADGSIRLSVSGTLSDAYEVTVLSGGGQTTAGLSATDATMPPDAMPPDAMPPAGNSGSLECSSLEVDLREGIASAFREAPGACTSDDDCVQPNWSVDCYLGCGGNYTIAASAVASTLASLQERTAPICAELESCDREAPSCPQPEASIPACLEGSCQTRRLSQMSCQDLSNQANQRRFATTENANRVCDVDADCALVELGVRCVSDCSVRAAVASSAIQQVQGEVEQIESLFCVQSEATGCPLPPELPCPPSGLPRAVCASGRCEVASAGDP